MLPCFILPVLHIFERINYSSQSTIHLELSAIIPHIEALIFASEKPLTSLEIVELINNALGFLDERISLPQVESCIEGIQEKYQSEFYPFEMKESGGGWQFLTKRDFHKTVAQLNGDKFLKRLSTAALETLSIIAYKQPVTVPEIQEIRGVHATGVIKTLLDKKFVASSGRKEVLGRPILYKTTREFLIHFGLKDLSELPSMEEFEELIKSQATSEDTIPAEIELPS